MTIEAGNTRIFFLRTGFILAYLLFFIGLIFSFRAVSSVSVGLLLLVGLFQNNPRNMSAAYRPFFFFIGGACILFLWEALSVLRSNDRQAAIDNLRIHSGLIIIPAALWLGRSWLQANHKIITRSYCLILAIASIYCLLASVLRFQSTFYHTLVAPIGQHAVYFSIYIFIALLFLLEAWKKGNPVYPGLSQWLLVIFLSGMLLLLASKLILAWYGLYLLVSLFMLVRKSRITTGLAIAILLVLIGIGAIVLLTRNPVSQRFNDILKPGLLQLKKDQYSPGDYFNGLEFRLLQWKWVPAILNKEDAWFLGMGTGDGQAALDHLYREKNMYTGEPSGGQQGLSWLQYT